MLRLCSRYKSTPSMQFFIFLNTVAVFKRQKLQKIHSKLTPSHIWKYHQGDLVTAWQYNLRSKASSWLSWWKITPCPPLTGFLPNRTYIENIRTLPDKHLWSILIFQERFQWTGQWSPVSLLCCRLLSGVCYVSAIVFVLYTRSKLLFIVSSLM